MSRQLTAIRSVMTFGILYSFTAVGVALTLVLTFLRLQKPVHKVSMIWAKSVFIIIGKKYSVEGAEFLDGKTKYILLANHGSLFDIVAIMSLYPGIAWFGHERLLKVPLFGRLLLMNGYIPFREPGYRNTKAMIEELITTSANKSVAIFPEGTRTLDGNINSFYRGFIYLLRHNESDILPVTLNGFYDLKPKNRPHINFRADLEIIIHEPVSRNNLLTKTDNEIISTVKSIIESAYRKSTIPAETTDN